MAVAAPVIEAEMDDWERLGGQNLGIVGDSNHGYGGHLAAEDLPSSDYTRQWDPNGADGPFTSWKYAVSGDFSHKNNEALRAKHRTVLDRLMRGELPMIAEFIGKPWADRPVYYWARSNGIKTLQRYTGSGHDRWSHITWYRSRADQRAYLWVPAPKVVRKMLTLKNHFPELKQGDRDPINGTMYVHRAQMLILVAFPNLPRNWADGYYGPETTQCVKEYNAKYLKRKVDGKTIDAATFNRLVGLS